jgi:hypothetical protein
VAGIAPPEDENASPVDPLPTLIQDGAQPAGRRPRITRRSTGAEGTIVLERYRLVEPLGSGGFGEVWRARDQVLDRDVALKSIELAPGEDGERAAREALAAARLSHPAIVALYEACATEDAFYLVSELVEGATLADLIAADALTDEEVVEIGLALAAALEHAHRRGVIHRDIKPQNVLVPARAKGSYPHAKLTDFGGASLAGDEGLTRTGDIIGTLAYMAPEQSEGGRVGEEADLYALALVLYEALAGVNPVRGATPAATARRIGARIERLARHRPDLPRPVTDTIDAALHPDPRERGTLAELRDGLQLDNLGSVAPLRRTRRPAPRSAPAPVPAAPEQPRLAPARATPASSQAEEPIPTVPEPARWRLPRGVWIGCGLALIAWQAVAGRPGVALLAAAALVPTLALPGLRTHPGSDSLLALLAPALGVVGLAGAFPALAGQLRRPLARAGVGALGYWWLVLAEPLLARRLWLGTAPGTPTRTAWEGSLDGAAAHVVGPLLVTGVALGAALWALAALVLPWLVRGRSAALDVVAASAWSAGVAAAAPALDAGLRAHAAYPSPRGAVIGAVLGGAVAVAARALRGPAGRAVTRRA